MKAEWLRPDYVHVQGEGPLAPTGVLPPHCVYKWGIVSRMTSQLLGTLG